MLFPRAHEARDELPAGLRSKGWSVSEVEAYRTVPASSVEEPDPRAIERSARAGIAVFASPSAVTSYVSMHGGAAVPGYAACIGPTTAAAAGEAGFSVEVVPASPRPEELVDALSRWWSSRRPPEEVLQ
ncbi:MAG: uroporphyrinogen-III synthase [Acidimicrobiales bacterium]